jgi:two-component system response regulator DevR
MAKRVFIVEDHELTRRGLVDVLRDAGFTIAAEAGSLAVARSLLPRLEFDVAVVDLALRDGDGAVLVQEIRELDPRRVCVVLSASDRPADLFRALRAGADGYLTKDMATDRFGETLEAALRGEAPLSRQMTAVLVHEFRRMNATRHRDAHNVRARLTLREWEILMMLADGQATGQIAITLFISIETVRSHIKATLKKLDVHTRAAAVALAEELRDELEPSGSELSTAAR